MRIGYKISWLVVGTALSATAVPSWIGYSAARTQYAAGIDRQLTAAAAALPGVIGEDYLNRALAKEHPSAESYDRLVRTLSDLADRSSVFYLYVFAEDGDKVVHLATSASPEERAAASWPVFHQPYEEPPDELMATFADGKKRFAEYTDEFGSFRSIFVRQTGPNGRPYVVGVDVTLSQIRTDLNALIWRCLRAGGVVAVLTGALGIVLGRRISRPIKKLADSLRGAAETRGDLKRLRDERRRDELGLLARSFNTFIEQLWRIRRTVANSTSNLNAASSQIAASARQQEQTVHVFRESTSQAATAVAEIAAAGRSLQQVVGDVHELAQHTKQKAANSRASLTKLDALLAGMGDANDSTCARMEAIKANVDKIDFATATILSVADQTNLLSVNAAIEAEKAGEHAAGFRVVAREIRRLAERTAQATLHIETIVAGIHDSVAQGVADASRSHDQMESGIDAVRSLAASVTSIMSDVESLGTRFDEVNQMVGEQAAGSAQIHQSIEQLNSGAGEIAESAAALSAVTAQLQTTTDELQSHVTALSASTGGQEAAGS